MFGVLLLLAAGVTAFVPSAPGPLLTKPAAVRAASMAEGHLPAAAASEIQSLSKKQLVQLAKKAGLKVTGNKREITLRITKHLSSPNADAADAADRWVAEVFDEAEALSFQVDVAEAAKEVASLLDEAAAARAEHDDWLADVAAHKQEAAARAEAMEGGAALAAEDEEEDEAAFFLAAEDADAEAYDEAEDATRLAFFEVSEETEVILPGFLPAPLKGYVPQGAAAAAAAADAVAAKAASLKVEGAAAIARRGRRAAALLTPPKQSAPAGYVPQGFAAAEAAAAARPSMPEGFVPQSSDAPFFEVTEETELVLHGHLWASKGYVPQGAAAAAAAQVNAAAATESAALAEEAADRDGPPLAAVLAVAAVVALHFL
ncbi:hypothetical protein EMIHUDRAFT_457076 [Emiliania huxleyi CCMP1516]|uniref:SAP domain-containing protein n=2 Tax=Emiliania huxleyi TaxID=2903 RepID=A0A0D3JWU0_EMIH1|nr:hypothetical protein EMIHUDRAFT_457076 [Emiliania huxleyi CCMP1516]EOD27975.1 hypothetical protein EMIHUDRAFT_457076 [Emiliania huxleyi CCMP1516]|eukprot:XP_005780404.1 hypothetical protein EMIHUDRAFT_457076 [Emiliania huxleyi CCMP1516]